jgi:hypothetical protein
MYTPLQILYIKGSAGDPLPKVWDALDEKGTRFLRGQLCLICAGPGTGKSAFVLTYAPLAKVPTLYFSADSDAFTQLSRSLSILTGWSIRGNRHPVPVGPPVAGLRNPARGRSQGARHAVLELLGKAVAAVVHFSLR